MGKKFLFGFVFALSLGIALGAALAWVRFSDREPSGSDARVEEYTPPSYSSTATTAADKEEPLREVTPEKPIEIPKTEMPAEAVPAAGDSISAEECAALLAANPLYADPVRQAARTQKELMATGRIEEGVLLRHITCYPVAVWLGGGPYTKAEEVIKRTTAEAAKTGKIVVFAVYNTPDHNAPIWHSSLPNGDYLAWIDVVARAIGNSRARLILEPDTLPMSMGLSEWDREERIGQIRAAVNILSERAPNTRIYLDIGHSTWLSTTEAAELLRAAGIDKAHGFSLNVSNYQTTDASRAYGMQISQKIGGKPYVIDTARNGNGPSNDGEWRNAPGRALGMPSQMAHEPLVDAYLWIKPPGESDGTRNGGPTPGIFWLEYALGLVRNAI